MPAVRVAIIDDDIFRAHGMASLLGDIPEVEVALTISQDGVTEVTDSVWQEIDVAVVEILDETAPSETGTDLFSGISAIQHIKKYKVCAIALVPEETHPLIDLRIVQAGCDFVYRTHEVQTVQHLRDLILQPAPGRRPVAPTPEVLEEYGARRARPNDSVREYEKSPFYGRVSPTAEIDDLQIHRTTLGKFRLRIGRTGFTGTEQRSGKVKAPRWPDVRSYLLRILGRDTKH